MKRLAIEFSKAILAIVVLFAIFAGYGFFAERSAKKKAAAICASITPGQNPAPLRDQALADGASDFQTRWGKADGMDTLFITYVGLPPFSRHMCFVRAKDGKVVSAKLAYLD
ncbi:hypothetical protein [Thermomonas aquatica]|uniref:Uncharacterized protein n=1 Tax=Thermomonas aquatica TaxID=2202149 RepID=A0A5B7ZPH6_9GAMM|nr:hypothetical protein [Thermomonas aquatica]QDA56525.1 hypothetical protein FHQ07_03945 [Thermomonas aquatica]